MIDCFNQNLYASLLDRSRSLSFSSLLVSRGRLKMEGRPQVRGSSAVLYRCIYACLFWYTRGCDSHPHMLGQMLKSVFRFHWVMYVSSCAVMVRSDCTLMMSLTTLSISNAVSLYFIGIAAFNPICGVKVVGSSVCVDMHIAGYVHLHLLLL